MTILEAHEHFARRTDRSICPADAMIDGMDVWPAFVTAAASLSGMLDECRNDEDLDQAVLHYGAVFDLGGIPTDDMVDEVEKVMGELMRFGDLMAMGVERN